MFASTETDTSLLNAARMLDEDALARIFDLYSAPLYNYALRLSGDPVRADHIVGDVFAKLLEQFSLGSGPSTNLRSYLYQTVYHLIVDEARGSRHTVPLDVADMLRPDTHASIVGLENRIMFEVALRTIQSDLTDDQRHVVILRYLEGFSLRETAAITGITVTNVKVIQTRAITKIRQALNYDEISKVACSNVQKFSRALNIP